MTSPFRTNPSLGPNLHQIVEAGKVWYDNPNIVSPKVGDYSIGDDGHYYVFVKASEDDANRCGECVQCQQGLTHIEPCEKEQPL